MSDDLPVACNAGPLMVLAKPNQLHLLKELYGRVHLANSVYDETVIEGMKRGHEDARTLLRFLMQMGWEADPVATDAIPNGLDQAHLDRGERDTLALAVQLGSASSHG